MSKVDFDNFAENYNELLRQDTKFFSSDELYFSQYKVQIARSIIDREPTRILEYGCGIGRNIQFFQHCFKSAEICGSDISAKSLEIARVENPGVCFWQEGDEKSAQSGFDLIFVAGVFHHVPLQERPHVAEQIEARLNHGGSAVVFEHNPYNPVTRRIVSNCPYDKDAVLLTSKELCRYLEAAGLKVINRAYALFFPPFLKRLSPLERRLGWLPLGGQHWVHALRS